MVGARGQAGAAVQPVFAREISAFEQELAPIRSQVTMESTATETARSNKTAWVSIYDCNALFYLLLNK